MVDHTPPKLDDPAEVWLIHTEVLLSRGDPRGELIIIEHMLEPGAKAAARQAVLERHADAIYGSLAPFRARVEIACRSRRSSPPRSRSSMFAS